jgi:hypothetical protein
MRGDGWQVSEKVDRHLNQFKTEEKLENSMIYVWSWLTSTAMVDWKDIK